MARWNLSSWLSHNVTQQPYVPATPAAVRGQVYVQELPARFNTDVDTPLRFGSGIAYRASRVLHEFVRSSEARALRVQDANVIWVPLYTGFVGRRRILNHASKLKEVDAALQHLPHWPSRQAGHIVSQSVSLYYTPSRELMAHTFTQADHIFVVEMDRGRCFQSDLELAGDRFGSAMVLMYEGTRSFGRLYQRDEHGTVTGSVRSTSCCFCRKHDLVIPPLVSVGRYMAQAHPQALFDAFSSRWPRRSFWERRRILANFRGDPNQSDWRRPNVRRLLLQHTASAGVAP